VAFLTGLLPAREALPHGRTAGRFHKDFSLSVIKERGSARFYQTDRTGYCKMSSSGVRITRACTIVWQISMRSKGSFPAFRHPDYLNPDKPEKLKAQSKNYILGLLACLPFSFRIYGIKLLSEKHES
jgi:hypothetical protein